MIYIRMHNTVKDDKELFYLNIIESAYSSGISIQEAAIKAGVNPEAVNKVKRKYGIKTKRFVHNKRITKEIEKEIIDSYLSGVSSNKVAKKFGYKTSNTVLNVLKKYKIIRRKGIQDYTQYNLDIFHKIDNHVKAYILGLLYTDGYVYRDYRGVCIQLTESDGYLLRRIACVFGKSSSLIHIDCSTKRKRNPNAKDMFRLGVYSPKISKDLKKLGIVRGKTYVLTIPRGILAKKYIYSFARGVIDGDGTLGVSKRGYLYCRFVTKSEKFARSFAALPFDERFSVYYRNSIYIVELAGGQKSIVSFLQKMYKEKEEFYLERKYEKVKNKIC